MASSLFSNVLALFNSKVCYVYAKMINGDTQFKYVKLFQETVLSKIYKELGTVDS